MLMHPLQLSSKKLRRKPQNTYFDLFVSYAVKPTKIKTPSTDTTQ